MEQTEKRTVEIRPIETDDDVRVASIIRTVMPEYGAVGEGYSIEDPEVDAMAEAYAGDDAAYFVVLVDDVVVGGAGIGPLVGGPSDTCELKKMYLLKEARGLGIGKRLMHLCLDAARTAGYRRCYLETLGHMAAARALYESHGFRELDAPMGATGHTGCSNWYVRDL
ncbi:MAG: GNAT family N-acetyltransferase [Gemmatimonadota bacterium]